MSDFFMEWTLHSWHSFKRSFAGLYSNINIYVNACWSPNPLGKIMWYLWTFNSDTKPRIRDHGAWEICVCVSEGLISKMAWGLGNWRNAMTSKFWIEEKNTTFILGTDLLSSGCVLSVDNRDLSPYHLDTETGEGGHIRSGHWSLFSLREA